MGSLLSLLTGSGALKDVFDGIGSIIGKTVTDPNARLQATQELAKLQADTTLKLADLDTQWAATQASVVIAEAKSESWVTRNWRPITMLTFVVFIGIILVTGGYINGHQIDKDFTLSILGIIKIGLGGYVVGRSIEKTAPAVTQIFASNKK